jgi:hypothetical protein
VNKHHVFKKKNQNIKIWMISFGLTQMTNMTIPLKNLLSVKTVAWNCMSRIFALRNFFAKNLWFWMDKKSFSPTWFLSNMYTRSWQAVTHPIFSITIQQKNSVFNKDVSKHHIYKNKSKYQNSAGLILRKMAVTQMTNITMPFKKLLSIRTVTGE